MTVQEYNIRIDATLAKATVMQMDVDRVTGTPGPEECNTNTVAPVLPLVADEMQDEEQREFVALCSIINHLTERANELANNALNRILQKGR